VENGNERVWNEIRAVIIGQGFGGGGREGYFLDYEGKSCETGTYGWGYL